MRKEVRKVKGQVLIYLFSLRRFEIILLRGKRKHWLAIPRRAGGKAGDLKRRVTPICTNACSSLLVLGIGLRRWIVGLTQDWDFSGWVGRRIRRRWIESIVLECKRGEQLGKCIFVFKLPGERNENKMRLRNRRWSGGVKVLSASVAI